jgi:hypothetical protein
MVTLNFGLSSACVCLAIGVDRQVGCGVHVHGALNYVSNDMEMLAVYTMP